jgi:cysteine desulfurase
MPIYLDHAATTPLRAEALAAMLPWLTDGFGNPSSAHSFGRAAHAGLDDAREKVAAALGARPREIVFTSGGSESNNLALKGAAWAGKSRGHRIVTTAVEHHSVGHTVRYLEKFGFEIVELPVDRYGRVDPDELESAITPKTILVSVMTANNEVGTIQPIAAIAERVRRHRGVLFHTDAVQAAPYLPIDVSATDVDLVSIAAHKFGGPKGVGALWLRHGTNILAQQQGGSQERYRRAGTEDVASAAGMARALELAVAERPSAAPRLAELRDCLARRLCGLEGVTLTGHATERLPGIVSVVVRGVDGSAVAMALDLAGVACSTGSACVTGSTDPSHVLTAMGYPADEANGSLRFSLGHATTEDEVDTAAGIIETTIRAHREAAAKLEEQKAAALVRLGGSAGSAALAGGGALAAGAPAALAGAAVSGLAAPVGAGASRGAAGPDGADGTDEAGPE